ncbi:MAG TPA: hypothetical protein VHV74_07075 [Pseudonocardiaceae bacterium]|nr:hypothetical protein [Pseudonocardiaceae bacterium]
MLRDAVSAEGADPATGLAGFHRAYGTSPALHSGLHRMWAGFEDRLTAQLATEHPGAASPGDRLLAIQLIGIVRSLIAPEVRSGCTGDPDHAQELIDTWITSAVDAVDSGHRR